MWAAYETINRHNIIIYLRLKYRIAENWNMLLLYPFCFTDPSLSQVNNNTGCEHYNNQAIETSSDLFAPYPIAQNSRQWRCWCSRVAYTTWNTFSIKKTGSMSPLLTRGFATLTALNCPIRPGWVKAQWAFRLMWSGLLIILFFRNRSTRRSVRQRFRRCKW